MCRTTAIIGTLKDGSLEINNLPLKNCFSCKKRLQIDANALSKMVLKTRFFCQKAQNFV